MTWSRLALTALAALAALPPPSLSPVPPFTRRALHQVGLTLEPLAEVLEVGAIGLGV